MGIKVIKPGLFTTVQDLGRYGFQASGISVNGVMDKRSAELVNILLGNDRNDAVLEMTVIGPTLHFTKNTVIAIIGADMSPTLNGSPIERARPFQVMKGDLLAFGTAVDGARTYLGVKGGLDIPNVLHSKSTNQVAAFGGFNGRSLQAGDLIDIHSPLYVRNPSWGLFQDAYVKGEKIRFIRGRQYDWFTTESQQLFEQSSFTISKDSDRKGFRLLGPTIELTIKRDMITEGTTFGTIQVPPNGVPIILMADRQPTGGYPKIGEVISVDLSKLSQMRPGDRFTFEEVTIQEAQNMLFKMEQELAVLQAICQLKWTTFTEKKRGI